jgi:hypothetical protein
MSGPFGQEWVAMGCPAYTLLPLVDEAAKSCSLCEVIMRKRSRARNAWLDLWADACSLGFEASSVIGLRTMKLAAGGKAAATEAQRMVREKIAASLALQGKALSGGLGTTALIDPAL